MEVCEAPECGRSQLHTRRPYRLCKAHHQQWVRFGRDFSRLQVLKKTPKKTLDGSPEGFKICRDCQEELPLEQFHVNRSSPDGYKIYCKNCCIWQHRKARYGLTREGFDQRVVDQNGRCAICPRRLTAVTVDHDHKTGKTRSLLCYNCNNLLGMVNDDITILEAAIEYLKQYEAVNAAF